MIDDTTIVESSANVVLNSTDDQGLTAVSIDITSGLWTVFYGGKSDGSQTWNSSVLIYYKTSSDAGATWSAETLALASPRTVFNLLWMVTIPRVYGYLPFPPVVYDRFISNGHVMQIAATPGIQPRARYQARFGR
jgi:hypothetical protein